MTIQTELNILKEHYRSQIESRLATDYFEDLALSFKEKFGIEIEVSVSLLHMQGTVTRLDKHPLPPEQSFFVDGFLEGFDSALTIVREMHINN